LPGEIERFVPKQIPATQCLSAEQALQLVRRFDDRTLVTGSLFLVGEVLSILNPAGAAFQSSNQ
jgi:folylpolyglutamate synthase/dihydropteroate synthase